MIDRHEVTEVTDFPEYSREVWYLSSIYLNGWKGESAKFMCEADNTAKKMYVFYGKKKKVLSLFHQESKHSTRRQYTYQHTILDIPYIELIDRVDTTLNMADTSQSVCHSMN